MAVLICTTLPHDGETGIPHQSLISDWGEWIAGFADWTGFVTLTVDPKKYPAGWSSERLWRGFRWVAGILSQELFGNHYRRIVGHCYFPYAFAVEPHRSDLLHAHVLLGSRVNWSRFIELWQGQMVGGRPSQFGICKIEPVTDKLGSAKYLAKYMLKGGDTPKLYKPKKLKEPRFEPYWYATY